MPRRPDMTAIMPPLNFADPSGLTQIAGLASNGRTVVLPRIPQAAPPSDRPARRTDDPGGLMALARELPKMYAGAASVPPPRGGAEPSYGNLGDYFGLAPANPARVAHIDDPWFQGDTAADRTLRSFLARSAMIPGLSGGAPHLRGGLDTTVFAAVSHGQFASDNTNGKQASA